MYIEKLKQIVIGSDVLINNFLYIVIHHHQLARNPRAEVEIPPQHMLIAEPVIKPGTRSVPTDDKLVATTRHSTRSILGVLDG